MKIETCTKAAFAVIGKEGATSEGPGFLQKLWAEANARFCEVEPLAKRDEDGNLMGIWGAMSDFSRSFQPWEENFTKGLYLAGVECAEDAEAPAGWTKWTVPGYAYLRAEVEDETTFSQVLDYMCALFGVRFHCLYRGPETDDRRVQEIHRKVYSSYFSAPHMARYIQLPLAPGEAVHPAPRWLEEDEEETEG